jgi:hypothetical protein
VANSLNAPICLIRSRNDINPPSDNFSDARLPQRQQCAQGISCDTRSDNRSDRYSNNAELQAFKEGYRQAYRDGFMDGQREQPVRVGRGQGSYCPEYNDYANSRQAYQEEAWLNRGDDFDRQQRRPIPQFVIVINRLIVIVPIIAIMIGIVIVGLHALAMSAPFQLATMIMTVEMDVGAGTSSIEYSTSWVKLPAVLAMLPMKLDQ